MANIHVDKLIDYEVYKDGTRKLGTADVKLPSIEYMSETLKGAGIAGEIDMPTLGQTSSMNVAITWRTVNGSLIELAEPKAHNLEFRGAQQNYDAGTGELKVIPVIVSVRALPKKIDLGKLVKASTTDSSTEMEIDYLKITIDGTIKAEIDKANYKCSINGTDYLSAVRSALGLN